MFRGFMSYYAGRWARAQTLVLDRDSVALAVLKELADDYRDDQGACRIDSYKKLALAVGLKKPDTASAAVSRLQSLGLIKAEKIYSHVTGQILGTRFSLVGYVKAEWPESRQGQLVWVETAIQKGLTPQKWWPQKTGTTRETDITQKKDVPHETDVPRQTGEGTPSNGERYPAERGEGTPSNGDPLQGLTGNTQGLTGVSMSPLAPARDDQELTLTPDEKPKTKSKRTKTTIDRPDDVGEQVWDEFLILRKQKRKTFTELALKGMRREAEAAGLSLEEAMTMCVEHGWQSFQAKYVRDQNGSNRYRSKRQPTCPGDWENEYKGVDYTRGAVMKEFTPEESAELERYCEEMGF